MIILSRTVLQQILNIVDLPVPEIIITCSQVLRKMGDKSDVSGFAGASGETTLAPCSGSIRSNEEAIRPPSHKLTTINRCADYYNMNHAKRGDAIIFNHYEFEDNEIEKREGTKEDCKNLTAVLSDLDFTVTVHNDLTYGDIYDTIQTLAKADYSESDCLLITVLTHGDRGRIIAYDQAYTPDELWEPFTGDKCPTLDGKPKMFFIQACCGKAVDDGVRIQHDGTPSYTIPRMPDILVMFSTYDGFRSYREVGTGSSFIESICKELRKFSREKDLQTILTFVNREMAITRSTYVPNDITSHKKRQVGTIVSTFTRLLFFYPPERNL